MNIHQLFIRSFLFLFLGLASCKPSKKVEIKKEIAIQKIKDSLPKYPSYLNKKYVLGKFNYAKNDAFVQVPKKLSNKTIFIRKEVLAAFLKMQTSAKKENIQFTIISGTRNFEHQKRIWNYKWNDKYKALSPKKRIRKILEFSAMPSTSRHHWGTDIDLNNLNNSYFSSGKGKKEYEWLVKHAPKFGFQQVYTSKKKGRTGYNEEKWHWSYIPLSSIFLEFYNENITYQDINNFKGAVFAEEIDCISNYVNGINPEILYFKHPFLQE